MFVIELGSPAKGLSPSCSFPETPIKLSSETSNSPSNITNQTTPNNILTTTNIQHAGSSSIETTTNLPSISESIQTTNSPSNITNQTNLPSINPDTFVDLTANICDIEEDWYADLFADPYDDAPGINDIPSLPPSITPPSLPPSIMPPHLIQQVELKNALLKEVLVIVMYLTETTLMFTSIVYMFSTYRLPQQILFQIFNVFKPQHYPILWTICSILTKK